MVAFAAHRDHDLVPLGCEVAESAGTTTLRRLRRARGLSQRSLVAAATCSLACPAAPQGGERGRVGPISVFARRGQPVPARYAGETCAVEAQHLAPARSLQGKLPNTHGEQAWVVTDPRRR